jgi:uncharacterized protein DUF4249
MRQGLRYILGFLMAVTFAACQEVILIDVIQAPAQLVIDGLVSDQDTTHMVHVMRSADFNDEGGEEVVNATVEVRDNLGNVYNYTHNPEGIDSLNGYYFSDQKYAGQEFAIYQLSVIVDNITFNASDTLRPVTDIDSLSFRIDEHALNNADNDGEIYQLLLYAKEPQESLDFYYFKFYRDSVVVGGDHDIYVFDDKVLGGSLDGLPSPVLFKEGELAKVEMYSLTRQQYIYLTDLASLLNSDGGMFSPPPANPRTNISGGALGLFQVSSLRSATILIEP